MSEKWVIDATTGVAWVHPAQATEDADRLLNQLHQGVNLLVPGLWFLEMANALLVLERRKRLKAAERSEALTLLRGLNAKPDPEATYLAFGKISELAERHGLSIYDATYLELALREGASLATRDKSLQEAARACGVRLLLE